MGKRRGERGVKREEGREGRLKVGEEWRGEVRECNKETEEKGMGREGR